MIDYLKLPDRNFHLKFNDTEISLYQGNYQKNDRGDDPNNIRLFSFRPTYMNHATAKAEEFFLNQIQLQKLHIDNDLGFDFKNILFCPRITPENTTHLNFSHIRDHFKTMEQITAFLQLFPNLTSIDLSHYEKGSGLAAIIREVGKICKNLTTIDLTKSIISSEVLEELAKCSTIEKIIFFSASIGLTCYRNWEETAFDYLSALPKLHVIDLRFTSISPAIVKAFGKCRTLKQILLPYTDRGHYLNKVYSTIDQWNQLESLQVKYSFELMNQLINNNRPNLKSLYIEGAINYDSDEKEPFDTLPCLETLALLTQCEQITHLTIIDCKVTDFAMRVIANHLSQTLISLKIKGVEILTEATGAKIGECTNLRTLQLHGNGTEGIHAILANCKQLETVKLSGYLCTNDNIGELPEDSKISSLSLKTFMSDSIFQKIGNCKGLQALTLYWCNNITDDGVIDFLKRYPGRLTKLDVRGCSQISDKLLEYILNNPFLSIRKFNTAHTSIIMKNRLDYDPDRF